MSSVPVPCEFCGKFTCTFVKDLPQNQALHYEAATQESEYKAGIRKDKPKTVEQIGSDKLYQSTM